MDNKPPLLIVEDDPLLRQLLTQILEARFQIHTAGDIATAKQIADQYTFDVAVIDIQLPDGSGLAFAQYVRQHCHDDVGIICLSGDNSPETVVDAYKIGVDDFIAKPFDQVTFHQRVVHFIDIIQQRRMHQKAIEQSHSIAKTAMVQASSYGSAMQLIADINRCTDETELAKVIIRYFKLSDLKVALQFRKEQNIASFDCDRHDCGEMEHRVFEVLHDQGRIYHFGSRSIFNDQNVSILVKNMPTPGAPIFDALLDVIAKLVPAINMRYIAICDHQTLLSASHMVGNIMTDVKQNLVELEHQKREFMRNLELQISMSFHALDMDEKQERFFIELIEKQLATQQQSPLYQRMQTALGECLDCLKAQPTKATNNQISMDEGIELF